MSICISQLADNLEEELSNGSRYRLNEFSMIFEPLFRVQCSFENEKYGSRTFHQANKRIILNMTIHASDDNLQKVEKL